MSAANAGWRDLLSAGNGARFLVVTGGVALHAVSIYVVATIMPTVVGDLGGLPFFAWTTTLYVSGALTGAAAVPLVLARGSPRLAYRLAFLLFLTGSLLCAAAPIMPMKCSELMFEPMNEPPTTYHGKRLPARK